MRALQPDSTGRVECRALFAQETPMDLQLCYNASEDTFPLPLHIKQLCGPFGFSTRRDTHRPYISSNFVMGLDGSASFTKLKGRAGGKEPLRSDSRSSCQPAADEGTRCRLKVKSRITRSPTKLARFHAHPIRALLVPRSLAVVIRPRLPGHLPRVLFSHGPEPARRCG